VSKTPAEELVQNVQNVLNNGQRDLGALIGDPAYVRDMIDDAVARHFGQPSTPPSPSLTTLVRKAELPPNLVDNVLNEQLTMAIWRRTKVIYEIDSYAWKALGTLKPNQKVWTQTFSNLPDPYPFVYFPEPIEYPVVAANGAGVVGRIHGAFLSTYVSSGKDGRRAVAAVDQKPDGVLAVFVGRIYYEETGEPLFIDGVHDILFNKMMFEINDKVTTLTQIVDQILERYHQTQALDIFLGKAMREHVMETVSRVVALLSYLGSTRPDVERTKERPVKKRSRRENRPTALPNRRFVVGRSLGAPLRLWTENPERVHRSLGHDTSDGRALPRPYWMSPHINSYWCTDRSCTCETTRPEKHLETRWINGYWAAAGRDASDTRVRKVRT
jgi:hypothetical protein